MKMLIKVGTMPVSPYFIKYKRKIPKVGECIFIKDVIRPYKWEFVKVWMYSAALEVLFVEYV